MADKLPTGLRTTPEREQDVGFDHTMSFNDAPGDSIKPLDVAPSAAADTRYVVQGEFARGGLGRVLAAFDERLARRVAIKELLPTTQGAAHVFRFQREAAITARLQHPAIVPVYDSGTRRDGQPFYVMKLLDNGRTLAEAATEARSRDERLALLPNVIAVADAIAYAHSVGVVHRDIKPSNVLLGPFGETVVIDWGLAKELDADDPAETTEAAPYRAASPQLTSDGSVIGTPQFMAPEQARGERVDRRADVYALGALLYFILGGVAPFGGGTSAEVISRLLSGAPDELGRQQPGLPPDLVAIVNKAMARDPSARYASAQELADDLKRFQTGQLVRAHEYSTSALLVRWVRRHKLPTALVSLFIVVVAATVSVSMRRILRERNRLILAQAKSALDSDPTLAIEWLKTYPADGEDWGRAQAIAADAQSRGIARHLLPAMAQAMALFPDGKRVVTGGPYQTAQVWDMASGALLTSATFGNPVSALRLSPDATTIVVADRGGAITLWDPQHRTQTPFGKHDGAVAILAYSADGRCIATASVGRVCVWDAQTRRQLACRSSNPTITQLAFVPDDNTVIYATIDGIMTLWDADTGSVRTLSGHVGGIDALAISRDGKSIITGGRDFTVRLWDRHSGVDRILGWHEDVVRAVAYAPTAGLVAAGGLDRKVRLWHVDGSGGQLLGSHADVVNDVVFSPDGRTLASCSTDRQVRLWDVATGNERTLRGHRAELGWSLFSPDGTKLVSGGWDEHSRVWDLAEEPDRIIGRHGREAVHAIFSPTGAMVATDGVDRMVRLWDLAGGKEVELAGADYSGMTAATGPQFSRGGTVLVASGDNIVRWWDLQSGAARGVTIEGVVRKVTLSPDGNLVAIAGSDGLLRLWDVMRGGVQRLSAHAGEVTSVVFGPNGGVVASAGVDGTVRLWQVANGGGRIVGRHAGTPRNLVFSPDGSRLASGDSTGAIKLWDIAGGKSRDLIGHVDSVSALTFSRDGRVLASGSWDRTARVWNLVDGTSRVFRWHEEPVRTVALSPDGRRIATGSSDATIRIWDLATDDFVILRGHSGPVRAVAFSPDGGHLVSAGKDGTVRLWNLGLVHTVPHSPATLRKWMMAQTSATLSPGEAGETASSTPASNAHATN
jgi:WD40 repeat protein